MLAAPRLANEELRRRGYQAGATTSMTEKGKAGVQTRVDPESQLLTSFLVTSSQPQPKLLLGLQIRSDLWSQQRPRWSRENEGSSVVSTQPHTHTHRETPRWAHAGTHIWMHAQACTRTHIQTMHTQAYAGVHTPIHRYMHTYIHTWAHRHTHMLYAPSRHTQSLRGRGQFGDPCFCCLCRTGDPSRMQRSRQPRTQVSPET